MNKRPGALAAAVPPGPARRQALRVASCTPGPRPAPAADAHLELDQFSLRPGHQNPMADFALAAAGAIPGGCLFQPAVEPGVGFTAAF